MAEVSALFSTNASKNFTRDTNGTGQLSNEGYNFFSPPVLVVSPPDAFSKFVAAFMVYALVFRGAEFIATRYPHLLGEDVTVKTKYEALYRFTRCFYWSIAALCVLPSVGAMIDHVVNDNVEMMVPSQWHYTLLQVAISFSAAPIYYDLCGRRDMHWTTVVHHVATCCCTIINVDWGIGSALAVYHTMTCFFVLPLDLALGLCAIQAAPATCVRWLTITKYTAATVYALAQVGILSTLWKMHKQYRQQTASVAVQAGFSLAIILDVTLLATQLHLLSVLHGMAKRRREAPGKKVD